MEYHLLIHVKHLDSANLHSYPGGVVHRKDRRFRNSQKARQGRQPPTTAAFGGRYCNPAPLMQQVSIISILQID